MSRRVSDAGFDRVVAFLADELAFESGYYNDAYLGRRIDARVRRTDSDSYAAYLRLLKRDDAERAAVLDSLSVNVTSFFRNPEVWAGLRPVLRDLRDRTGRVRAWSAPCSDGREPYSLAMLALDEGLRSFSVVGTDIDRDALERAREGVYASTRTAVVEDELAPLENAARYVEETDAGTRVVDRVKRHVTFERHDLVRDDPKSGFDLAFCRNLLIYIDADYKRRVVDAVADGVREGGYVVLGKTERLPRACRDRFEEVDASNRIYRRA